VAFIVENQLHTVLATSLYNEILSGRTNFHFFMGGQFGVTLPNPDTTTNFELLTRNNLLSTQYVSPANISLTINRINWISGTVYDFYDDNIATYPAYSTATSLTNAQFYVYTTNNCVYKCLNNNNNAQSTVMPTGTSTSRFTTADGYIWKFMYNIPAASVNRFVNSAVIPVQISVQEPFYSNGLITSTTINNQGSGYTTATIAVVGDGTGAILTPVLSGGQITNVTVTNPGVGYTYAILTVVGTGGTGATLTANMSVGDMSTNQSSVELLAVNGSIENCPIIIGGSGYTSATVLISGDGTGATATANISGGVITSLTMVTQGSGYHYATVTITGNGTGATARAIMSPQGGHGHNAINELCTNRILFYSTVTTYLNQGITINNSVTQCGLIRDIRNYGSSILYYGTSGSPLFVFNLTGSSFQINDILQNASTGNTYSVFAINGSQALVMNLNNEIPTINMTLNNTSRVGINVISAITNPTIDKFSGDLLYVDNASSTQSPDQIITFKTSIEF
jgi:hypothetical protein